MASEENENLMTINTHLGLCCWIRLPYGIASSQAIFQGIKEKLLHGMTRVVWYLDDILVSGETEEKYLQNLNEVLARLGKSIDYGAESASVNSSMTRFNIWDIR